MRKVAILAAGLLGGALSIFFAMRAALDLFLPK